MTDAELDEWVERQLRLIERGAKRKPRKTDEQADFDEHKRNQEWTER